MTRRKIAGLVLAVVTILFLVYCILFLNQNQEEKIEKGVVKAMKNYSENLNEDEIQVLTKEIDTLVNEKLNTMEKDKLTQQQLEQLLKLVSEEITNRLENLTENEIHLISNRVLKEVLEKELSDNSRYTILLEQYKKQIDQLTISMNQEMEQLLKEFEEEITKVEKSVNKKTSDLEKNLSNLNGSMNTMGGNISSMSNNLTTVEKQVETIIRDNELLKEQLGLQEKELEEINTYLESMDSRGLSHKYDSESNTLHLREKSGDGL